MCTKVYENNTHLHELITHLHEFVQICTKTKEDKET